MWKKISLQRLGCLSIETTDSFGVKIIAWNGLRLQLLWFVLGWYKQNFDTGDLFRHKFELGLTISINSLFPKMPEFILNLGDVVFSSRILPTATLISDKKMPLGSRAHSVYIQDVQKRIETDIDIYATMLKYKWMWFIREIDTIFVRFHTPISVRNKYNKEKKLKLIEIASYYKSGESVSRLVDKMTRLETEAIDITDARYNFLTR